MQEGVQGRQSRLCGVTRGTEGADEDGRHTELCLQLLGPQLQFLLPGVTRLHVQLVLLLGLGHLLRHGLEGVRGDGVLLLHLHTVFPILLRQAVGKWSGRGYDKGGYKERGEAISTIKLRCVGVLKDDVMVGSGSLPACYLLSVLSSTVLSSTAAVVKQSFGSQCQCASQSIHCLCVCVCGVVKSRLVIPGTQRSQESVP